MELVSQVSANLPREKFVARCSYSKFSTVPDYYKSQFPCFTRKPLLLSKFHFQARNTRNRTRKFVLLGKKQQLWGNEQEHDVQDEEEASSYSDDGSSFLSLSEKPDRNMALLDDYEIEELDFEPDPNHQSG